MNFVGYLIDPHAKQTGSHLVARKPARSGVPALQLLDFLSLQVVKYVLVDSVAPLSSQFANAGVISAARCLIRLYLNTPFLQ